MAIENDFTIYPYSKVIRHTGNNDNVYSVTDFYSYLMDVFDEPGYMSYERPMKYNTPTSYTMLNGWFLDNGAESNILEFLTGGTIDTSGYTDDILMVDVDALTDFVLTDKDLMARETTDVGPLLAYKNDYAISNEGRLWIRDTETHGGISDGQTVEVTTAGGTGTCTSNGAAITGDEIYTNIYTIAAFAGTPDLQVYIRQNHPQTDEANTRITEWSNTDSWDRDTIDVLIPVKLGGAAIDSGKLTIFGRQTGDTFTHTEATVSVTGGARTPIAMETSKDEVNITKGEHYLLYDAGSTGCFSIGDVIQNVSTSSLTPPDWYAEVVAVDEFTVDTTGVLTLRGLRGTITDGQNIYVGTASEATTNGTPGDTYTTASAVGTELTVGLTCTGGDSTAKKVCRGIDAGEKAYVFQVDNAITGSSKDVFHKDFTASETITDTGSGSITHYAGLSTTVISGFTDVTLAHVNGTVVASNFNSTFEMGEVITWNAGGSSAIIIATNGTTEITLANVDSTDEPDTDDDFTGASSGATADCDSALTDEYKENFEFPLQATSAEYAVFIQGGSIYNIGRSLGDIYAYLQYKCRDGDSDKMYTSDGSAITEVDGQFYIKAYSTYAASKVAPLGTLAGGVFFGAQGAWIEGMASADANNIKVTDDGGTLRFPYTSVNVTIGNTRISDVIGVYLEDGTTGLPKKDTYTSHNTNNVKSASAFDRDATDFPNDTPSAGAFIVVAVDENEEHRYRYTEWSGTTITLATEVPGTAEAGTSGQTLFDTGVFASGVQRGDIIRRTTDDTWCYVISVDNANQVTTTILSDGSDWAVGNGFEVNSLVQDYDNSDKFFIPYMDAIEDTGTDGSPGSEVVPLTYVSARDVVIRVRNVLAATAIQPFVTTSEITAAGMTVSVIRTTDEVYT